jgi:predicted dehydrogenase
MFNAKRVTVSLNRRRFLRLATASVAGVMIVPRHVVAASGRTPPSERLNIAGIGIGGMGRGDLDAVAGESNLVALCDVDLARGGETFAKYPQARRYRDFRRMLDEMESQIDAVVVATPDHTHAVAAIAAMKRGKHVYCEKPLAHSIYEVRQMMKAAREHQVVTQLGNQGHSSDSIRTFCEWIWDGAIGQVHTIHAVCGAVNSALDQLGRLSERHEVPSTLEWDLWLGPAAERPYHPAFLPGTWRRWTPFGNGTVGDWICHVVDPVFWALDLGAPTSVQAKARNYDPKTQGLTFPMGEIITYEFPAKGKRGPVTLHWYSGTEKLHVEGVAEDDVERTGALVIGDKGMIAYGSHGAARVRLLPEERMREYKRPAQTLPRVRGHHRDWLDAIRHGRKAGSDFTYGGPLTELGLLGVIAIRMLGTKLEWDAPAMRFRNNAEADRWLNPPARRGWEV